MKVEQAAQVGLILVVIHLVLSFVNSAYGLARFIPHLIQHLEIVVRVLLSLASWVLLDVALILVFAALSRTRGEQIAEGKV